MTKTHRFWLPFSFALLALLVTGFVSLKAGPSSANIHYIITQVRLPRYVLACLLGAGLGVAGLLLQLATRNPLSEPELLGINQTAVLTVVLASLAALFALHAASRGIQNS